MQQTFFEAAVKSRKASGTESTDRTKDRLVGLDENVDSPENVYQYSSLNNSAK